ncbi:hypothetical protein BS47DRAFT_1363154 [Hydnum rufescens UP504]|uniref:Uncharacterized protein n=1 Tax=Hydnum rufescens UP504 TaxID=1448309 RepID=A0A9P6DRM0_9AGAM|nr:hypothetical protein BS47DRAFT_1363154 [Hydnum rufescens UP504]
MTRIPPRKASRRPHPPLRVWSKGCGLVPGAKRRGPIGHTPNENTTSREPHTRRSGLLPQVKTRGASPPPNDNPPTKLSPEPPTKRTPAPSEMTTHPPTESRKRDLPRNTRQMKPGNGNTRRETARTPDEPHAPSVGFHLDPQPPATPNQDPRPRRTNTRERHPAPK